MRTLIPLEKRAPLRVDQPEPLETWGMHASRFHLQEL